MNLVILVLLIRVLWKQNCVYGPFRLLGIDFDNDFSKSLKKNEQAILESILV
jgi:hypothetical protein